MHRDNGTPRQSAQGNAVEIAVHALTHPCVLVGDWCRNHELVHNLGAFHGAQATAWIEIWSVRRKRGHAASGRDRQKNRSVGPRRLKVNGKKLTPIAPHRITDRVADRHWSSSV